MEKIIVKFVIFIFISFNCIAQPNGGFENWSTEYTYLVPDNWQTLNFLSITTPPNPISAYKATGIDKHSGNFALKLKTIFVSTNPVPDIIDDTVGLVFKGKVIFFPPTINFGFPFTERPEKLEFWSKYSPVGNDTGGAIVVLRKWNGLGQDTIASGRIFLSATGLFTKFQVNLNYFSTELPDSADIIFGSSLKNGRSRVGSTLYIDDVAFTGWVGIQEKDVYSDKVKIVPNPATDAINILAQIDEANNVNITDAGGKEIGLYLIRNYCVNINTELFAKGIYFYEIRDKKNKVLTKDKFVIIR